MPTHPYQAAVRAHRGRLILLREKPPRPWRLLLNETGNTRQKNSTRLDADKKICALLAKGLDQKSACCGAGVPYSTYNEWKARGQNGEESGQADDTHRIQLQIYMWMDRRQNLHPRKLIRGYIVYENDRQHDARTALLFTGEEIARLKEFVDLCERLQRLKRDEVLDALANTLIRLAARLSAVHPH